MSTATSTMLRTQAILIRREPALLIWSVAVPVVADIVLAVLPGTSSPNEGLGGLSFWQVYLPTLVVFSATLLGVQVMPTILTQYRTDGILRRLRTTPASPMLLLGAVVTILAAVSLVVSALLVGVPLLAGRRIPGNPAAFALVTVLMIACMIGIGAVISALVPNARFAGGVGAVMSIVLWFFAGLWVPRVLFPGWLARIADVTPSGAATQAMLDAQAGSWPSLMSVVVLLGWCVGLPVVAVRAFRWE